MEKLDYIPQGILLVPFKAVSQDKEVGLAFAHKVDVCIYGHG
jgi:hypothetical protein